MNQLKSFTIPAELNNERFDVVAVKLAGVSRNKVRQLIDSGGAFLNKKRIWIAKFAVATDDLMELRIDEDPKAKSAHNIDLTNDLVVAETDDFLVLNKPVGIAVDSATNNIMAYLERLNPKYTGLFLAHRLDKDTSGLLIVAKSESVRAEFEKIFAERKIQKTYRALCFDTPNTPEGTISFPIVQHSKGENKYYAITDGVHNPRAKNAKTDYKLLESLAGKRISFIECYPRTGRPHQIRAHLRAIGNPVLGDKLYADHLTAHPHWQTAERQMLHAHRLQFNYHEDHYDLTAGLPKDFEEILNKYRQD